MKHALLPLLTSVALLTACSQPPPPPRDHDAAQARYVDATTLTSGDTHYDGDVLTSVPLQHITAVDAEARLRAELPDGVLVARTGQAKKLLLQGPAQAVVEAIRRLTALDVR